MKKRAVGYPRVSGVGQGESGYSLGDQVTQIEQFCRDKGLELVAHFLEVESAATIAKRPSFKAALRHLYTGNADILVVTNLDRFSRSVLDTELLRQSMERHGKKLISVQQKFLTPLDHNPDDEDEIVSMRQKAAIEAELERKKIRRRCLRGKARKISEGGWGGNQPWYEVDVIRGKLVENKERMRIVRLMLRLRRVRNSEGKFKDHPLSFKQISDYLNGDNRLLNPDGTRGRRFPSPAQREGTKEKRTPKNPPSNLWNKETVRRICQNFEKRRTTYLRFSPKEKRA